MRIRCNKECLLPWARSRFDSFDCGEREISGLRYRPVEGFYFPVSITNNNTTQCHFLLCLQVSFFLELNGSYRCVPIS